MVCSRIFWTVGAVLVSFGCAGQRAPVEREAPLESTRLAGDESRRLVNRSHFDLANCWPKTIEVSAPANTESLTGALLATRPQALECLVDPAHRGNARETDVRLKVSADEHGATFAAEGDNLSAAGAQCIERVLQRMVKVSPLPIGSAPVGAEVPLQHALGGPLPAVELGVNAGSDLIGGVRLATPRMCECFAPWKTTPPEELRLDLTARQGRVEARFDPARTLPGLEVAACVEERLDQLTLPLSDEEVSVPYRITLIDSYSDAAGAIVEPRLQFLHLDHRRGLAQAESALALGRRNQALASWDALVGKYEQTKDLTLAKELETRCGKLLAADDAWASAVEGQLAVERDMVAKLAELGPYHPMWKRVEGEARKQLAGSEEQVTQVKQLRTEDAAACPKLTRGKQWNRGLALRGALVLGAPVGASSPDLESRFSARVSEEYAKAGWMPPALDPTLSEAARRLASHALTLDHEAKVAPEPVVAALFRAGGWDPEPRWIVVRTDNPNVALEILEGRRDLAAAAATHVGIAVANWEKETAMVALLSDRRATLSPFPRQFETVPASETLCGSIDRRYSHPFVFVTPPEGETVIVATEGSSTSPMFCAPLNFPQPGLYWIELTANGAGGPEALARFVVDVAAEPAR